MEIDHIEIDPHEGLANDPTLILHTSLTSAEFRQLVDSMTFDVMETHRGTAYFAEKDGLVRFYFHNPNAESGYGGHTFNLPLTNGTVRAVKGPWSSRCEVMNKLGFVKTFEVVIVTADGNKLGGFAYEVDMIYNDLDLRSKGYKLIPEPGTNGNDHILVPFDD